MNEPGAIESTGTRSRIEELPFIKYLSRAPNSPGPFYHENSPGTEALDKLVDEAIHISDRCEHRLTLGTQQGDT